MLAIIVQNGCFEKFFLLVLVRFSGKLRQILHKSILKEIMMTEKPTKYGKMSQVLHWATALFIFMALVFGTVMTEFASGAQADQFYNNHVMGGWILLVLMVLRLVARWREPAPDQPEGLSPARAQLFKWNHILLYVFVFIMLSSGVGILSLSGLSIFPGGITVDGIQKVPPIAVHDVVSKFVLFLILMHIGGVMQYQFTKGNVLARMGINFFKK